MYRLRKNDTVNNAIFEGNATVENILTENGFTMQKISNIVYLYTKSTADNSRTSKLRIVYNKSGNIDKSEVEMFIESENDILALENLLKVLCKSQTPMNSFRLSENSLTAKVQMPS